MPLIVLILFIVLSFSLPGPSAAILLPLSTSNGLLKEVLSQSFSHHIYGNNPVTERKKDLPDNKDELKAKGSILYCALGMSG